MKMKYYVIFVLIFAARASTTNKGICPSGWMRFGSSCYLISKDVKTWLEAHIECSHHDSHLLRIDDKTENEFLKSVAKSTNAGDVWFDLTDEGKESHWRSSVHPANRLYFSDWYKGQPDGKTGENCGSLRKNFNYQWNDRSCGSKTKYICEKGSNNHMQDNNSQCARTNMILDELVECKRKLASKNAENSK